MEFIEPTEDEARNGWTAESLTEYHRKREKALRGFIGFEEKYRTPARPTRANSKYRPLMWRG